MRESGEGGDQAGKSYWDGVWRSGELPSLWSIESTLLRYYPERKLFSFVESILHDRGLVGGNTRLVEAGCARSAVLPLFAKRENMQVFGVDYSSVGCEQARAILDRENVSGEIFECNLFELPKELNEKFDVVVSFGLVEHFSNSVEIIGALADLLKPGGIIITCIPNMSGVIGLVQKWVDRKVFDVHVPITREELSEAHAGADLRVDSCDYFMGTNFGVCNINSVQRGTVEWWAKKVLLALLVRLSMGGWWLERRFGLEFGGRILSAGVNCVATKVVTR